MQLLLGAETKHEEASGHEDGGEDQEYEARFRGEGTVIAFCGVTCVDVGEITAEEGAEEVAHCRGEVSNESGLRGD